MLSREATNTNFIIFGLTRPGLEPTIYHNPGEHANHYNTDVVFNKNITINTTGESGNVEPSGNHEFTPFTYRVRVAQFSVFCIVVVILSFGCFCPNLFLTHLNICEWVIAVSRQMINFQLYHGENKLHSIRW
jgi:hypothetical protein